MRYSLLRPLLGSCAILLFTITGCQEGPAGAVGPEGPAGSQGPAGQDGQDGEDGNANVRSVSAEFSATIPANSPRGYTLDTDILTTSVIESGAVYSYIRFTGEQEWWALPYTATVGQEAHIEHLMGYAPGQASMSMRLVAPGGSYTTAGTIRLVAIDGPPGGSPRGVGAPPYEELAARYDLPLD